MGPSLRQVAEPMRNRGRPGQEHVAVITGKLLRICKAMTGPSMSNLKFEPGKDCDDSVS